MRLRLRQFRPRTGPHEHRLVQPLRPLRHTSLRAPEPVGLLLGDHDGLSRLAGLFSFAACSRHTLVHVPLRGGAPPDEGVGEPVDLLLVHHSYGLRTSMWPALRRALGPGGPLSVRTDEARTARDAAAWRGRQEGSGRQERPDRRDELRHVTHARTLILFGSRDVFAETAISLAHAAGWGPRRRDVDKGHPEPMTVLPLVEPPGRGGGHPDDVMVCFKAYPPYAHFRRPGEPARRPHRPAAAP
ncbi:hypothetical protein [Streptomyces sp. IBSBF 3136]|uniref:hypothetical protein n=1 Tax=Streptomyces sp. IBSBF 3136 TaxID=2903524 RepID=UPI002FDBE739